MLIVFAIWIFMIVFYTLYIAAINMYHDWASIATWVKVLTWPILVSMITVDFIANVTLFTFAFLDLPRELLVTKRLERYRTDAYNGTRRQKVAVVICTQALNPFDPTRHHC